jgi:GNAT superfamily N-acetyltransferase
VQAQLREYHCYDVTGVVDLWNRCLPADPITREIFDDRILLDPNFDPAGCWVAMQDGRIVGFVYALVRRTPLPWGFESAFEHDRQIGWIFALFVHEDYRRQGIGSALLDRALAFLEAGGVKHVILGNYAPNYVLSGVDTEAYPGAREFLEHHGFAVHGRSDEMVIARRGEEVVGYCQHRYGHHAERTGPFGVKAELRGRKIGTLMLYRLLARMAQKGYRAGWFAQTGDRQRRYYERVGYRVIRTEVGMRKEL